MNKRWTTSDKAVYNIGYHLIWSSKCRQKVLTGNIECRLKELLNEKAKELELKIEKMEIMPDYVHLFVRASPVDSPHFIVQQFKRYSSHRLRREYIELLDLPTLWTRSYYCESVGHISEDAIKKYIEEQKNV